MFETTHKAQPKPVLTCPEAPATTENKTAWAGRIAGANIASVRPVPSASATEASEREPRVDALRGLFLVLMMLDHLPDHPLMRFTTQTFGFVSAAEGFVFVSGLVSGWVYGRIYWKQGNEAMLKRAVRRARDIYLTHVFLFTVALLGGLCGGVQLGHQFGGFWSAWGRGALLIFQPPLFGILPMYAIFLAFLPLLLRQMAQGRASLVWAASILLWLAAQWGIGSAAHNPPWLHLGFFNVLAWQLLFVAGVYFGHRKNLGLASPIPASRSLVAFCMVLVTAMFVMRHQGFFFGGHALIDISTALDQWRSTNHPLRLLNFSAYAYILWYIPHSVDAGWHRLPAFRFLHYLGKHSLQVFSWSIFVSYIAYSCTHSWTALPAGWRAILAIATVLSLAIPAKVHERLRRSRYLVVEVGNNIVSKL
jgi:hypothetical protein